MKPFLRFLLALSFLTPTIAQEPSEPAIIAAKPADFPFAWNPNEKWAEDIAKLSVLSPEAPTASILFAGSSSFRFWDLTSSFPKLPVVNHGFGGSTFPDLLHFAEELIFTHQPSTLVIYEGDNDLHHGRTPDQVFNDWQTLVTRTQKQLPSASIIFVSIKPSVQRWHLREEIKKANALICTHCASHSHLHFADISNPMLEYNGIPKAHLFEPDALHLNEVGYKVWAQVLGPMLAKIHSGTLKDSPGGE